RESQERHFFVPRLDRLALFAGPDIPQLDRPIHTGGSEKVSRGRNGRYGDGLRVSFELGQELTAGHLPCFYLPDRSDRFLCFRLGRWYKLIAWLASLTKYNRNKKRSIGAEVKKVGRLWEAVDGDLGLPRIQIVDGEGSLVVVQGQPSFIGAQGVDGGPWEGVARLACGQVVEMNPVPAPVSQDLALRAEQRMGGGLVLQGGTFPVRRNVPQFDFVPRSSNQGSVVGTEVATLDRVDVTGQSGTQLTGGHV